MSKKDETVIVKVSKLNFCIRILLVLALALIAYLVIFALCINNEDSTDMLNSRELTIVGKDVSSTYTVYRCDDGSIIKIEDDTITIMEGGANISN